MTTTLAKHPTSTDEKTSILLRRLLADLVGEEVRLGDVMYRLRRRSFGGVFIMLAALGLIPGISVFTGIVMLLPAIQMTLGFQAPLLPRFLRRRQVSVSRLRSLGHRVIPWVEMVERYAKPRWLILSRPPVTNLVGIVVIGLALVVTVPLPFSNLPPAIALLCLALGLLERDGLMISIGLMVGSIALAIGGLITYLAVKGIWFTVSGIY